MVNLMADFKPVSRDRHTGKLWQRFSDYSFAAGQHLVSLAAPEFSRAVLNFPIALIRENDQYVPVAVLGLLPGRNLFITRDGKWLGKYVPAVLRSYPFRLAQMDNQQVLCVDENSQCFGTEEGLAFFTEHGEPAAEVKSTFDFLNQLVSGRASASLACGALEKYELLTPWDITLKIEGTDRQLSGLYKVDEAALNALPADALLAMRASGGLPLAYCQLLSMQHLAMLGRLANGHEAIDEQQRSAEASNDTFSFGALN